VIATLRITAFKHGYLIITAAWLYTLSILASNYWSYNSSPEKVQQRIEQQLIAKEKRFNEISADTNLIVALAKGSADKSRNFQLNNELFGLFVYSLSGDGKSQLSYWNSNQYYTDPEDIERLDGNYFLEHQNGKFELIKKTIRTKTTTYLVIALLPVRWKYFIENKYLVTDFADNKGLSKQYDISIDSDAFPIHSLNKIELFKIKPKDEKSLGEYDIATILLRTLAVIFLLFFLNNTASDLVLNKDFAKGFALLVVLVLLLRVLTYILPIPFDFRKLGLFDPAIYASNFLHPSLGDLLINSLIAFWLINFYRVHLKIKNTIHIPIVKNRSLYFRLVLLVAVTFFTTSIVQSLVFDSKISFDVTNFFSLDRYSVVSFLILSLLILSFYNLSFLLLKACIQKGISIYIQLIVVVISGLIFLGININNPSTLLNFYVLAWLVIYIVIINLRKQDLSLTILQSSFFIFWIIFFAITISILVLHENKSVELVERKRIAEQLAQQSDPSGESLLSIATTNFNDKFLADNFYRLYKEYSNKFIKDSLINQNFSGYLNRYDTRIYTFDESNQPLFNDDSAKYTKLKTIMLTQGKPTAIAGLYGYESSGGQLNYLFEKIVKSDSIILGHLFVVVKPKKYVSEALYPELFKQTQALSSDLNADYAYAIYNNGKIINRVNDYDFPSQLSKKELAYIDFTEIRKGGYDELWYNAGNGKQVFIVKTNDMFLESIALFAYLFCSFLLVILFFRCIDFFLLARFKWAAIKQLMQFNIRVQIHATIIFISLFSFIVIGIATISFFIIRFNQSNEDRLFKSLQIMTSEIGNKLRTQLASERIQPQSDSTYSNLIEKDIAEISETHNVDVNFFDSLGSLKVSTQPYIYNKHLLSDKMEPAAFYQLEQIKKTRVVQQETIGKLSYLSIYSPITDDYGKTYAYLNIPYLNSQAELNSEISGFLAAIINLNAFIFLVAGAIAFLVTNRITSSFSLIGDKMKEVSFGKVNEAIAWTGNDEIGVLVNEYNKMVKKLEESAKALARIEREGAWREMARQVAHEIKNPLTPMKLSIQYLQRAITNGAANVQELSQRVASTLIEQIDQLSKIAGDFSQFANINQVTLDKFDISEVIGSLISLYQVNPNVSIRWHKSEGEFTIMADRIQINRLFTNLLKNAFEAIEISEVIIVDIEQKIVDKNVHIAITDYGNGIANEMQQKIFTPNFTTKSSGTGLGLAICRGIVENANGKIWFETTLGKGTSFFVELPLVD